MTLVTSVTPKNSTRRKRRSLKTTTKSLASPRVSGWVLIPHLILKTRWISLKAKDVGCPQWGVRVHVRDSSEPPSRCGAKGMGLVRRHSSGDTCLALPSLSGGREEWQPAAMPWVALKQWEHMGVMNFEEGTNPSLFWQTACWDG